MLQEKYIDDSSASYSKLRKHFKIGGIDDSLARICYSTFFYIHKNNVLVLKSINRKIRWTIFMLTMLITFLLIAPIAVAIYDYNIGNGVVFGASIIVAATAGLHLTFMNTLRLLMNALKINKSFKHQSLELLTGIKESFEAILSGEDKYARNNKLDRVFYNSDWQPLIEDCNSIKLRRKMKQYLMDNDHFTTETLADSLATAMNQNNHTTRYLIKEDDVRSLKNMQCLLDFSYKKLRKPFI